LIKDQGEYAEIIKMQGVQAPATMGFLEAFHKLQHLMLSGKVKGVIRSNMVDLAVEHTSKINIRKAKTIDREKSEGPRHSGKNGELRNKDWEILCKQIKKS
jgi:hypothetical protein